MSPWSAEPLQTTFVAHWAQLRLTTLLLPLTVGSPQPWCRHMVGGPLNMHTKKGFWLQATRPGACTGAPTLALAQVAPPSVERYTTFWRVCRPPPPPSFIAPMYTRPVLPDTSPVIWTLRMKAPLTVIGAVQTVPLSE